MAASFRTWAYFPKLTLAHQELKHAFQSSPFYA
jgi:hypothetical protein